jgi:hypothetical protein
LRILDGVTGGQQRLRRAVPFVLGALAVVSLLAVDPGALALLLDVDFLVLLGTVGLALVRGDVRVVLGRVLTSHGWAMVRAGADLTRRQPSTLAGARTPR